MEINSVAVSLFALNYLYNKLQKKKRSLTIGRKIKAEKIKVVGDLGSDNEHFWHWTIKFSDIKARSEKSCALIFKEYDRGWEIKNFRKLFIIQLLAVTSFLNSEKLTH